MPQIGRPLSHRHARGEQTRWSMQRATAQAPKGPKGWLEGTV